MRQLRVLVKHLLIPVGATFAGIALALIFRSFAAALILALVGCFWASFVIYRWHDRRLTYLISKNVRQLQNGGVQQKSSSASEVLTGLAQAQMLLLEGMAQLQLGRADRAGRADTVNSEQLCAAIEKLAGLEELPAVNPINGAVDFPEIKVAMIADEFTAQAFAFEWNVFLVPRKGWEETIACEQPDFLFVESAWEGNGGEWKYQLVGDNAPTQDFQNLIQYCKNDEIPTIFWNKEDPPHFKDFLETAKLCDYVFTTEGRLVAEYRRQLGHDRVAVLPFAAQPKLHNPARIRGVKRDRVAVFGGMYFREKYPERREQMEMLFPAAAQVGLDIYSRHTKDPRYQFPPQYQARIRGALEYPQMLAAYHKYDVVLNVNSVTDSETMCARRIFEATACGAAVVTPPTPAIDSFFPDSSITVVSDKSEAAQWIKTFVRSPETRERKVHLAQRQIWENHTYRHRAESIHQMLGLKTLGSYNSEAPVSFFVSTNRPGNIENIFATVARQSVPDKQLCLLTHGFELDAKEARQLASEAGLADIQILTADSSQSLGENLNQLASVCDGSFLFRMDDDDFYGINYARDLLNILRVTGVALAGKSASYVYFEGSDSTVLTRPDKEHTFTDFVRGATFAGPKETFMKYHFPESHKSEDSGFLEQLKADAALVYSADRFNYAVMRHADKSKHTWGVEDLALASEGAFKFYGFDPRQIEL
ncbi:MAG: glycosyltransferase [Arcanobacterium sp.]|nr:glycosyltransferase [Arcanobacterium sp.]